MRHIDPKDSTVFQEFERMAAEKGWIVQAALGAEMADSIRREINAVARMLPKTNAVLDLLVPLEETGGDSTDLRHALDALRAVVMNPFLAQGFDEQGGEARSLYHSARSMLHAPEGQGHLWLGGLQALGELLSKHYGQTVERSKSVPQEIDTEQAADTGFMGGGSPKWPVPDPMTRSEIDRLWAGLGPSGQREIISQTGAPPYVAPGTPHFYGFFAQPEHLAALRQATPGWIQDPGEKVLERRMERAQRGQSVPEPVPERGLGAAEWFSSPLVGEVQRVMVGLGADIKPDSAWGPLTNAAWNAIVERYGLERYGLKPMPRIFAGDQSSPSREEMEFMVKNGPALAVIERPGQTKPAKPAGIKTGPMPPEHIPHAADDAVLERAASVMRELVVLANDLDAMGASDAAMAIDAQLGLYKEAADKLYDITGETGDQLVGKAHPGGGPVMAPAQDEGGKMETIVEGHKKILEKTTKPPTGKQAAFVAKQLAALASRLDGEGKMEAAMLVDKTLDGLRRASRRPFVRNLRREGAEVGTGTGSLAEIFSDMEQDLDAIRSTIQNQVGVTKSIIQSKIPLWWESKNYGAEFDDMIADAQAWARHQADMASQLAADPKALNSAAETATSIASAVTRIRAAYTTLTSNAMVGAWDLNAETAFKGYLARLAALQKMSGYDGKKPAGMEKAKTEQKPEEAAKGKTPAPGPANISLQATVSKIIDSISAAYRGGATDRNLLDAVFKDIDIPGVTTPGTRGLRKALEVLKRAKSMRGKVYDDVDAQDYNDWLFNNILTPMKRGLKIVGSDDGKQMMKTAEAKPPPEFGAARRAPGRGGGRPRRSIRQDLMALQGMMEHLGYDLGPHRADGVWGPRTVEAWKRLARDLAQMGGPALPPAPPARTQGPPPNAVQFAEKAASYLLSVKGEASRVVTLAPGITVSESALASPQAFVAALGRIPESGISVADRANLLGKDNLTAATELLSKYRDALQRSGSPEARAVWFSEGGGAAALKGRLAAVESLLAQLPRAGEAAPPSGYGYEKGEGLPFGTLEGPKGARPGQPGYRSYFVEPERRVAGEAMRLLSDDLLDAMADTGQFVWYANNAWDVGRGMKAMKKDRRAVALAYITWLRDSLGRLRMAMTPAVVQQLGANARKILDRIALAVSYMSTLEDDLRYGSL